MKLSVCIPTYNQGSFLRHTILSVVSQELKADEIIVSNDCSTDDTASILKKLSGEISELIVINQPFNLGISKNVDACLRLAKGEFVVRIDSDDLLLPNYTNTLYNLLLEFPAAGYAHAAVREIDSHGNELKIRALNRSKIYQNPDEALLGALKGYRVAANILMFRRKALEDVDYIKCRENFAEDYFLSVAIAEKNWGNVYSGKVLSCYRVWADSGFVRQKRKLAELNGLQEVFSGVLYPAFLKKGWDRKLVENAATGLAARQADCLSWEIYSKAEKKELEGAILKLSDSAKTKLFVWLYKSGFSFLLNLQKLAKRKIIQMIKSGIPAANKN
jgi:glycosyltransferase involved in cell wall biosynthesis